MSTNRLTKNLSVEKWQSLGNCYLIIDSIEDPIALTQPTQIQLLCDYRLGLGADGVVVIDKASERGYVAGLRIFNPDGSEAELSGNGVRQACCYLRASGLVESDTFSVQTKAGEIRATMLEDGRCTLDIGSARIQSKNYVVGGSDNIVNLSSTARGPDSKIALDADSKIASGSGFENGHDTQSGVGFIQVNEPGNHLAEYSFQHVTIGNPQCSIRVKDADELEKLDLALIGPQIENYSYFPNRTNVSFWYELKPGTIRVRIFERGVGETSSSGTGACGAAITYVLQGGDSDVRVILDGGELEVAVNDALQVELTGSAERIYLATLSEELLKKLACNSDDKVR